MISRCVFFRRTCAWKRVNSCDTEQMCQMLLVRGSSCARLLKDKSYRPCHLSVITPRQHLASPNAGSGRHPSSPHSLHSLTHPATSPLWFSGWTCVCSLVSLPTIAGAGHVTYRVPGLKVVVDCVYTATPVSPVSSCHSCIHVLHLCTLGCKHTHRIRVHPMFNKDCTRTYLSIFDHIC
ncbi:uncharacterized protein LOC119594954 [Penaeus monodon]|uniref:uncharacterized protein LOC119594954 n=1 Tax=Penaeus monodon TaxID=6687 RepID=UPI0018A7D240|nr:uncharacterized protein LOC119594954 [Penaeus monodon]